METIGKMPRRQISRGVVFGAVALAGAIAMLIPFGSLGHSAERGRGASARPAAVAAPAPAAGAGGLEARAASSSSASTGNRIEPKEASNAETCDVQLD